MHEIRVVGPPGTGKSTELVRHANEVAREYGGDNLLVCSLTRAAAAEILGRESPIPADRIGTLHSFAYRACDGPEIADTPKELKRWNDWIKEEGHPYLQITSTQPDTDDSGIEARWGGNSLGDRHYGAYQVARARLQPEESLPESTQHFVRWWREWLSVTRMMDFTGMLETCLAHTSCAPGNPSVLFMDEAQDTSLLGMRLIRKWAEAADDLFIFGDPLQNLFHWAGTDPEAFTTPDLPAEDTRILTQSYRVPRAVHARALAWIAPLKERLEEQLGTPIAYEPRDAEGVVRRSPAHWKYPEPAVTDAEQQLEQGRTVMFLGTCSFVLEPLISVLRARGLPFHNPWRAKRGDWNPLAPRRGVGAKDRVLSYLRLSPAAWPEPSLWNSVELWQWVETLEARGILRHGAKAAVEHARKQPGAEFSQVSLDQLGEWFEPEALTDALLGSGELDLSWLRSHLLASRRKTMEFPLRVTEVRGPTALRETPRIVVGTIHSLKGSEADTCYVFPDLSDSGMQEWCMPGAGRDGIRRAFYVAMTRAREELVLCGQATPLAVEL